MNKRKILVLCATLLFMAASLSMTVDQLLQFKRTTAVFASSPAGAVRIPVLCYHSIADNGAGNEYVVSPEKFRQEMAWLHDQGYRSLSMEEFGAMLSGQASSDGKEVLITFDDGYKNNYTAALPILEQYGFQATEFLVTSWVGGKDYLTWDQVKTMQAAGWDIMAHTQTHPYLPLHTAKTQRDELEGSKVAIERNLGTKATAVAYPYGLRSEETMRLAKQSGYVYAFTFDDGWTTGEQNPYLLKRLFISGDQDLADFERKMHA
ncbi:polysaccharide deacetylase family protein [Paenibacillus sacheonensis]|uniref:Polysaccharide deacetylase family protein n=1 Tax=Paenibacillus sacheonensis TaxID=742054 RepID=A0A7X4YQY9_9BACL|nr:polysaccharide deacetylase family protein [Paenibacillus sacheonensis]MBM7567158.1 peptidoglycan/xylan/chitin deacetylase (PgdA/CDA1 family) [Paenibacillus sacheonensis]NBC70917.1 polysaccharide deacetylase family protein [Paenibacillus sacheonensis]